MTELENGLGNKFTVAAVQFCSNEDKNRNLKLASKYIDNAVKDGADVVVLPEMFNCCGHTKVMVLPMRLSRLMIGVIGMMNWKRNCRTARTTSSSCCTSYPGRKIH